MQYSDLAARNRPGDGNLPEITHLFSIAIILVVFGHSRISGDDSLNPNWYMLARSVVYSFHMQLFMFVSGFLFIHTNMGTRRASWQSFIIKKFKRLMVPYISIMSLIYLPRMLLSRVQGIHAANSLREYNIVSMLIHPDYAMIDYYWFLFTLFIIFCLAWAFKAIIYRQQWVLGAFVTIILVYIHYEPVDVKYFYIYKVCRMIVFFWLGCLFYAARNILNGVNSGIAASVLLSVMLMVNIFCDSVPADARALLWIIFTYYLALIYKEFSLKIFKYIDGYSYQIYLLSWFFNKGSEVLFHRVAGLGFYVVFFVSFVSAIVLPVAIARVVELRYPRLKVVIGL